MCMVNEADGDWVSFGDRYPTARKEHRCGECGRAIGIGETYRRWTGRASYGGFDHGVMCAHCDAASTWLREVCNGYLFHGIAEDLVEHWHESWEYRSLWLGRVIVGQRNRWRRFDGSLLPIPGPLPVLPHERLKAA